MGRNLAALISERLEGLRLRAGRSVYEITSVAGSVAGGRTPATNDRRKFAREVG